MQSKIELKIEWASHAAAAYSVKRWHYSRSLPPPPLVKFGVWENSKFLGVVVFAKGANRHLITQWGLKQTEGCELVRVALTNHATTVSRIISICIKMLKKKFPTMKLIISFADPDQGHIGSIYKAGNWHFLGRSNDTSSYIDKYGRKWHPRMISSSGVKKVFGQTRKVLKPSDCTKVKASGKYKYAIALCKEMEYALSLVSKPYPKRAGSVVATHPPLQGEEDGAEPIPALQTS